MILSRPKGNAEEYGRWSVNPYVGCLHQCEYCYLKKGVWAKKLGGNAPVLKDHINSHTHAYFKAMAEILENKEQIIRDGGVFMSFTSDPCANDTWYLFFAIAVGCAECGIPVTFLTKADIYNNMELQSSRLYAQLRCLSDRVVFGFTLTGHDELEPNAGTNYSRILSMQMLRSLRFKVWASIEPVIDFPSSLDMVYQALNAGCEHFKIGLLTSNTRVCRDRYDVRDCLHFVEDVMHVTAGKATVYWKQSVRDLFNGDGHIILDRWENAVGKDWSMFTTTNNNDYEQETIQTGDSGA